MSTSPSALIVYGIVVTEDDMPEDDNDFLFPRPATSIESTFAGHHNWGGKDWVLYISTAGSTGSSEKLKPLPDIDPGMEKALIDHFQKHGVRCNKPEWLLVAHYG